MRKIVILIAITLLGCNKPKQVLTEITDFRFNDSIYKVDTCILEIKSSKMYIEYNYLIKKSADTIWYFADARINKTSIDTIEYLDRAIPLVGIDTLKTGSKNKFIFKYYYDIPKSADEEEYVYIMEDYGIVILISEAWGSYRTLKRIDQPIDSIYRKIINDSTGFYFYSRSINPFDDFQLNKEEYLKMLNDYDSI